MRKKILFVPLLLAVFSCTDDRDLPEDTTIITPDPTYQLVHYWNFNDDSSDEALIMPTQTSGDAHLKYFGNYFDAVSEGSDLNARNNDDTGNALRLRNPSGDFIISLPTTGFQDAIFTFATTRTSSGPQQQNISYTTDGTNYITTGLTETQIGVSETFVLHQYNFTDIDATDNNPDFKIKITYAVNADGDSGNSRYDNITLDALPYTDGGTGPDPVFTLFHYWNFNDATSEETLITPNVGNGSIAYEGSYYDDVEGTDINARNSDEAATGLRLRNPSGDFYITVPTTGYKDILVSFAAQRSNSGSQTIDISYTTDGVNYTNAGLDTHSFAITTDYTLYEIDFSGIATVNNNADFKIKISFDADSAAADSGNNRFDNLTVEGNTL